MKNDKPPNFPSSPATVYRDKWPGVEAFLQSRFMPYEEARKFVRALKLQSSKEWTQYLRGELPHLPPRPINLPTNPAVKYREEWKGMQHFLDFKKPAESGEKASTIDRDKFLSYEEARNLSKKQNLFTIGELRDYLKDIGQLHKLPQRPSQFYPEWQGVDHFLGLEDFMSYEQAIEFARGENFRTVKDFKIFLRSVEKPSTFPPNPSKYYKEWPGAQVFLDLEGGFMSYKQARKFIQDKGLSNAKDFQDFLENDKPPNFPSSPASFYKDKWPGVEAFLQSRFMSFEEARTFVRALKLQSSKEWTQYLRGELPHLPPRPINLPSNPAAKYREEYQGIGHFLGLKGYARFRKHYLPLEEARKFVQNLKLKSVNEWLAYARGDLRDTKGERPDNIPPNPYTYYRDRGWAGFPDFLGNKPEITYMSHAEARELVKSLNLNTWKELQAHLKKHNIPNMPNNPEAYYRRHSTTWAGREDFLGKEKRNFLSLSQARKLVKSFKFKSVEEFQAHMKNQAIPGIPLAPDSYYKDKNRGWAGWPDFLSKKTNSYLSFSEARELVRGYGLTSVRAWRDYIKKNTIPNVPRDALGYYSQKNRGWTSWTDFLNLPVVEYATFLQAREFARSLKLKSTNEWQDFIQGKLKSTKGIRPNIIPRNPYIYYKGKKRGWTNWQDFLGIKKKKRDSFKKARQFARKLELSSYSEWHAYTKGNLKDTKGTRPDNIPHNPQSFYKAEWQGWPDFLGVN